MQDSMWRISTLNLNFIVPQTGPVVEGLKKGPVSMLDGYFKEPFEMALGTRS